MANTHLMPFQFETHQLSVLTDDHGEPWWIATEVCDILEVKNVSQAIERLDTDEKNTICLSEGTRGNPTTLIVNESGLYTLILGSRKKSAKVFKRWITHEVIPQIRKTGSYSPAAKPVVRDPLIQTIIDMAVQLDEARAIAQRADVKADLALSQQLWVTLREYAHSRHLAHQMPLSVCKAFGTYLSGYCLEQDIPVREVPIAFKAWKQEHAYHVELIDQLLPKWLKRQAGQITLLPSKA